MKIVKKIGSIVVWVLIVLVLFLNIYSLIDRYTGYGASLFGFRTSVIVSNSMSYVHESNKDYLDGRDDLKRIYKNDMIFTIDTKYEDLDIYDVVTYYDLGNLICHRIVDKYESDGKKYIVTRGDANNVDDQPFDETRLRGKVIGSASGIGIVFLFFQSLYGLLAIFICMFFIFLGMYVYGRGKDKKKVREDPKEEIVEKKEDDRKEEE